ncbi:MAG: hypothetical protein AAFY70_01560 [Bacteroidota bacterium]
MEKKHRLAGRLVGGLIWSVYLIGTLAPEWWWGTHFLAFFSPPVQYGGLAVSAGLILASFFFKGRGIASKATPQTDKWIPLGIALLAGVFMYHMRMVADYYGDAYKLVDVLDKEVPTIPKGTAEALWNLDLSPWAGHMSVLAIITYAAHILEMTYGEAFLWMGILSGIGFVWVWLTFVFRYLKLTPARWVLGLAGIVSPFLLIYFGHIESYAPGFLFFLLWFLVALEYARTGENKWLLGTIGVWLICLRLHPVSLLFAPAFLLMWVQHKGGNALKSRLSNWQGMWIWIGIPILLAGMVLYFFVFGDYQDDRKILVDTGEFDRLFLPLFAPDPPYDQYNMLSFNHIFDYFQAMLFWSPLGIWFAIFLGWTQGRKTFPDTLAIRTSTFTFVLFAALFFVINPLLAMQMDWDLMCLPVPAFLVMLLLLAQHHEADINWRGTPILTLGISLLTLPVFILHTDKQKIGHRLELLGMRVYHTYYEWSHRTIEYGLNLPNYDRKTYEERKAPIMEEIGRHALVGNDREYAMLLLRDARYYLRVVKNNVKGYEIAEQAYRYAPNEKNALLYMMEKHFLGKEYQQAYEFARQLLKIQYPSEAKAYAISIQCALEAGLYKEALTLTRDRREKVGSDPLFDQIQLRLETQSAPDSLKYLFSRGS